MKRDLLKIRGKLHARRTVPEVAAVRRPKLARRPVAANRGEQSSQVNA
jgi:hypothetical protein